MADREDTARVLRGYAAAWLASELEKVWASYHDDIEPHYVGESPLSESMEVEMRHSLRSAKRRCARRES